MTSGKGHRLEHPALFYSNLDGFLEVMVPYVSGGIDADEVVFVAARGDYLPALRSEVGRRADAVEWADTREWHAHPGTRLRAFYEMVTDGLEMGARRFRLAGEPVWPAGPPEMVCEWQRYESVLNAVLAPFPVSLICLYDTANLDPSVVEVAQTTHPMVRRGGVHGPSPHFEEPEEFLRRWNLEPPPPPDRAARMAVTEVAPGRRFLRDHALRSGVSPDRAVDLSIAANEVLTNALVHAESPTLWAWTEEDRFVCQVQDRGSGIRDSLAGYRPPPTSGESGRGLWMTRQLVDLLQITPGPTGTTVRLHMTLTSSRVRAGRGG